MMVCRLPYFMKEQMASGRPIFSNMMEIFTIWARSEDSRSGTGMPDLAVLTARAV